MMRKSSSFRENFVRNGLAVGLTAGVGVAGAQPLKVEQSTPPPKNPLSFYDGKLVLDVQDRLRLEVRDNTYDFNSAHNVSTDDTFLLQRFRLGLTIKPCSSFKAYFQGQDTREIDGERKRVPFVLGAEGDDPFDLRQGYFEFGDLAEFPLSAKVGRQEIAYGDERLIGVSDWNNFSRTFDAAKVRYQDNNHKFWVDAFAAHVVLIEDEGPSENRNFHFNESNWNDTFAGFYGSTTAFPIQTTEAYFLYRNKASSNPVYVDTLGNRARPFDIQQEIYTVGLRAKSTPGKLHGFDYELEGAYQFGRAAGTIGSAYPNATGTSLEHSAFACMVRGGYTLEETPWKPRLGLEYDVASGDSNPNDDKDESFLNLFPTNHKFYGYMDLFAWKNIHDPSVSLKMTPHPAVSLQLDGHAFWLYTNQDAWYRANAVTQVRPLNAAALSADRFAGTELDLTVGYTPYKWLKLLAGYSHFFAGQYLSDTRTATAGNDDANFGYLQATFIF